MPIYRGSFHSAPAPVTISATVYRRGLLAGRAPRHLQLWGNTYGGNVTKQRRVYESLREEILSATLAPGQRLLLNRLAERFEVSPIPVREALRQLEHEGLVDVLPHISVIVKELPFEEVLWAQELRLALEPIAAKMAAPYVSRYDVQVMRDWLDVMAGEPEGSTDLAASYDAFHDRLYSLTPNRRMVSVIERQRATAQRFRAVAGNPLRLPRGPSDLNLVMAAVDSGDADELFVQVQAHRQRVLESLQEWVAGQEEIEAAVGANG